MPRMIGYRTAIGGYRRFRISGNGEANEICHRAAGDENAARVPGKSEKFLAPIDDLFLDMRRRDSKTNVIHIYRGRKHLAEHAKRRSGSFHPPPKPRMDIAKTIGEDELLKVRVGILYSFSIFRKRPLELTGDGVRNRPP